MVYCHSSFLHTNKLEYFYNTYFHEEFTSNLKLSSRPGNKLGMETLAITGTLLAVIGLVFVSINVPIKVYSQEDSSKNATMIVLDPIADIVFNNTFFGKGTLIDVNTGNEIGNATIKFSGNGSSTLADAVTGGVSFEDPDGVEVIHISPGDALCSEQIEACSSGSGIDVLRLNKDGIISFSDAPNGVALKIQGMQTDTFVVEVIIANPVNGTNSFFAESFGAAPEISYLNVATLGGIKEIRIANVTDASANTDDGFVSISGLTAFDPLVDPFVKYQLNFTDVEKKTYQGALELHAGFFSSIGVDDQQLPAHNKNGTVWEITATFEGDSLYNSTSSTVYYNRTTSIFDSGVSGDDEEESESGGQGEQYSNPIAYSGTEYTSIDCATGDPDGDGLCTSWEGATGGITYGSGSDQATYKLKILWDPYRNLGPLYSDPNKKDVFLEIDYMTNHRPDDQAIQDVIDAFDAADDGGIELYVVVDDGDEFGHVPDFQIWKDSPENTDLDDFLDVKKKKQTWPTGGDLGFGTDLERNQIGKTNAYLQNYINAKAQAYHYGLFVHSILGTCGPSGHAERPGNDLVVSLGCGFAGTVAGHSGSIGSIDEQAGTLMHELGHNLNLRHGGSSDMNCKANYQSVMTYSRQMPYYFNQGHPWILDYSRLHLENLDESDDNDTPELHENSILSPSDSIPAESTEPERYIVWGKYGSTPLHKTNPVTSTYGDDWNRDNDGNPFQLDLSVDLNDFNIKGCGRDANNVRNPITTEIEYGYDDWAYLQFNFRGAAGSGFDGMAPPNNELDPVIYQQIISQTVNVIVDSYNTNRPEASEALVVSGSTNNAFDEGYKVTLHWGDGSISEGIDIRADGTWGPSQHVYGFAALFKNPHTVVAELVNGTSDEPVVSTKAFSVIVVPDGDIGGIPDWVWFWIAIGLIIVVIGLVIDIYYITYVKIKKKVPSELSS
jgi:hypothetical protein